MKGTETDKTRDESMYQQLYDGTCPRCCNDQVKFLKDDDLKKPGPGRAKHVQKWRCLTCNSLFITYTAPAMIAQLLIGKVETV